MVVLSASIRLQTNLAHAVAQVVASAAAAVTMTSKVKAVKVVMEVAIKQAEATASAAKATEVVLDNGVLLLHMEEVMLPNLSILLSKAATLNPTVIRVRILHTTLVSNNSSQEHPVVNGSSERYQNHGSVIPLWTSYHNWPQPEASAIDGFTTRNCV